MNKYIYTYMYLYVYDCICIYIYTYVYIYMYTYTQLYMHIHINIYIHQYLSTCSLPNTTTTSIATFIYINAFPFKHNHSSFPRKFWPFITQRPSDSTTLQNHHIYPFNPTCAHLFLPPQKKPPFFTQQHWKSIPVPIRLNSPRKIHLLPYYPEIFPYRANPSKPNLPIMIKRPETGD